jgi:hypothetical protein
MSENKLTTNNNPTMVAVDATNDETPVYLRADPITKELLVKANIDMAAEGIATEATLQDAVTKLIYMLDRLEYGQMTDNAKRLKVNLVESGALPLVTAVTTVSTVTAVTTVGTVTNQARIGDIQAQRMVGAIMDVAFSTGITNNLSII